MKRYFVVAGLDGDPVYREVTEAEAQEADGNEPEEMVVEADCEGWVTTLSCWQYYHPGGEMRLRVTRKVDEAMQLYLALIVRDGVMGEPK